MSEQPAAKSIGFQTAKPVGVKPYLFIAGGIGMLMLALIMFVISLLIPPGKGTGQPLMIGSLTVMFMCGAYSILWGITLLRSASQVEVYRQGLVLKGPAMYRRIAWSDVARAESNTQNLWFAGRQLKVITFYDSNGKSIGTVSDMLQDFDRLTELVNARVEQITGTVTEDKRPQTFRKQGLLLVVMGVVCLAGTGFTAWDTWQQSTNEQLMVTGGFNRDATIVQHHMYHVTPRIEYAFETDDGRSFTRNTMVDRDVWDSLEGAETVPIRYIASNPDYSRMIAGEIDDSGVPRWFRPFLPAVLGIMSLFFLGVGVMNLKGIDIDFDEKTRKFSIVRVGTAKAATTDAE